MNPQTWDQDLKEIEPGGYLFYDSTKPLPASKFRDDITVIGVPLTAICNKTYTDPRQRQLFKNIIYVGALSALLEIEPKNPNHHALKAMAHAWVGDHAPETIGRDRRPAVEQDEVTFEFDSPEHFTAYIRAISAPIRAMIEQHAGEAQEEAWDAITQAAADAGGGSKPLSFSNVVLLASALFLTERSVEKVIHSILLKLG